MRNIGTRIKAIRLRKGMTLQQLAEMSDLSPSFLSKLESGKVGVSIANLDKICDGLQIKTIFLLDNAEINLPLVSRKTDRERVNVLGGPAFETLSPSMPSFGLAASLFYSNPGESSGEPSMHKGIDELHYVVKGKFKYNVNNEIFYLDEGDAINHRSDQGHSWENIGDSEGIFIVVSTVAEG